MPKRSSLLLFFFSFSYYLLKTPDGDTITQCNHKNIKTIRLKAKRMLITLQNQWTKGATETWHCETIKIVGTDRSGVVHPCYMVSRCPVSRCQSPQFWWSRDVRSRDFSVPEQNVCQTASLTVFWNTAYICYTIVMFNIYTSSTYQTRNRS